MRKVAIIENTKNKRVQRTSYEKNWDIKENTKNKQIPGTSYEKKWNNSKGF